MKNYDINTVIDAIMRRENSAKYNRKGELVAPAAERISRREAEKAAIRGERVYRGLHESKNFRFTFKKADGSIREACGTLDPAIIASDIVPPFASETGAKSQPTATWCIAYWDWDRNAWRSCRILDII